MSLKPLRPSKSLDNVRYDIRGPLFRRAEELEKAGTAIIKLNIGNPGAFGFKAPEELTRAVADSVGKSVPYCTQKGIIQGREAIVAREHRRGVATASVDDTFVGNGCSELIVFALKALLDPGDEVLVPSPDYPLWTAAVNLNGGKAVHYPCKPERGFLPDIAELSALITPRTKALVIISPNNPTGAVYPKELVQSMVKLAEQRQLVIFSDEIYDHILYDGARHSQVALLATKTLVGTFGGLSKVHRACGWRVGWLSFSGEKSHAKDYLLAMDLLSSLRLCANVPGQWAIPAALDGHQSIEELTAPGGRLYQSRAAIINGCQRSKYLSVVAPQGAMYAFVRVKTDKFPSFDDQKFALDLLEKQHVLVTPGSSFNVPYRDHFRITCLPEEKAVADVFSRIETLLDEYAAAKAGKSA